MFDFSHMQCAECAETMRPSEDKLRCVCRPGFRKLTDYGGFFATDQCEECQPGSDGARRWPTPDGWDCRPCAVEGTKDTFVTDGDSCPACVDPDRFKSSRNVFGTLEVVQKCEECIGDTMPSPNGDRCVRCNVFVQGSECQCAGAPEGGASPRVFGGVCFDEAETKLRPFQDTEQSFALPLSEAPGQTIDSWYLHEHLQSSVALCAKGNLTACQVLGNLCVLTHYRGIDVQGGPPTACQLYRKQGSDGGAGAFSEWDRWLPWIYYERPPRLDAQRDIPTAFSFAPESPNSKIRLWAARFHLNGTYEGLEAVRGGLLQLCQNEQWILDSAYDFGRRYHQKCEINAQDLWNKYSVELFDLYLELDDGAAGERPKLYPVPILNRNQNEGRQRSELYTRRLFLVDNVAGKENSAGPLARAKVVRYVAEMTLHINLQATKDGRIFPPYLEIRYGEARAEEYDEDVKVPVSFRVAYSMETVRHEKDLEIVMGTLCSFAVLWSILRTMAWARRAGKQVVDIAVVGKFLMVIAGSLADVFFVVMLCTTLWILVAYKNQRTVVYMVLSREQEFSFFVYVCVAAALKAVEMFHLILEQVGAEVFFIDWERPRGQVIPKYKVGAEGPPADPERGEGSANEGSGGDGGSPHAAEQGEQHSVPAPMKPGEMIESPVTIWRTYLVANEWAELSGYRKTSYTLQLFLMVLLLKVMRLENMAIVEPNLNLDYVPREFEDSRMNRFGLAAGLYLAIGFAQWFVNVFIVERCFVNHFGSFVDLCSIANISVLCLTRPQWGYYIHGRSVHGHADTNMKEMNEMLQRERDNLCSQRGLENNGDVQCFTAVLPSNFREEFENTVAPLRNRAPPASRLTGQDLVTFEMQATINVYTQVNSFLCAFLEKRGEWRYAVRDRTVLEAVLDFDFGDTAQSAEFLRDPSEAQFACAFLYGQEWIQLTFDALVFCVTDLLFHDFLLAAVVTFGVVTGIRKLRELGGTRRLVRTSLVDSRFLI